MPANYYPPISLKSAVRLPKLILDKAVGHPIFRLTAAEELKMKDGGTTFRDLVTASNRYGLTKGSYKADKLELEDRARAVIEGDQKAILDVLFGNQYFAKVHQRYVNNGVPGDKVMDDYLKELGVGEGFQSGVRKGIVQNMRDWGLIQNKGGADRILPREMVEIIPTPQAEDASRQPDVPASAAETPPAQPAPSSVPVARPKVSLSPNLQVNIEIHIAADTPHETIEKIFESMGKHVMNNAGSE